MPGKKSLTPKRQLSYDVIFYTLIRLSLVVILGAIIMGIYSMVTHEQMPLLVALIFAVLIAFPLSLLMFSGLRRRINDNVALVNADRRREKGELVAKLRDESA